MKPSRTALAVLVLAAAALVAAPREAQASVAVSISVFHDDLAPYGSWVGVGSYGRCFVPRVAAGWAPYVDGQWVYTDYGWTWVSSDPFGDIPFHYGSWTWADPYGWVWVPGTVWAPAWVTWAYGDDYVGWAPVPPSFALTVSGYVGAPVVLPATRYVFVPTRQFVGVPVASIRLPEARNATIFARTVKTTDYRVTGGVVRTAGPPTARIERVAGTRIAPVSIDRVKARPTTLAEAGAGKAGKVRVAAPASETRKLAASSETAAARSAAPRTEAHLKTRPTEPSTAAAHGRETAAPSTRRDAAAPPAQAAKREPPKNEHRPPASHAAPSHEKAPASTQKREKKPPPERAPVHEAAPSPATAEARAAEPPRSEASHGEPREETRVAAHAPARPPANHPAHPPASKARPPEKKPERAPEQKSE